MLSKSRLALIIAAIPLLFGCAAKLACKESIDGVSCNSITSVYNREVNGKPLPRKKDGKKKNGSVKKQVLEDKDAGVVRAIKMNEEKPLRVPPKIVRIWIAPWEDSDGDLHQPEYIYSEITDKKGRWLFGEKGSSAATQIIAPAQKEAEQEKK